MKCYQQHKAQQKRHARRIDSRLKSLGYFSMEGFDSNSIHQQEENPPAIQCRQREKIHHRQVYRNQRRKIGNTLRRG